MSTPTAIVSVRSPIALSAPEPFFAATRQILSSSVGLNYRMVPHRSKTLSRKLSGLASQSLSALSCASRETPEAHSVHSTLLPPRVF
jgi:hypothetical protein